VEKPALNDVVSASYWGGAVMCDRVGSLMSVLLLGWC